METIIYIYIYSPLRYRWRLYIFFRIDGDYIYIFSGIDGDYIYVFSSIDGDYIYLYSPVQIETIYIFSSIDGDVSSPGFSLDRNKVFSSPQDTSNT